VESEKTYRVTGMTCAHCEASVREEVELLAGVHSATADHTAETLVVRGDQIDDTDIKAAVESVGYELHS
jgi:copper chaperone